MCCQQCRYTCGDTCRHSLKFWFLLKKSRAGCFDLHWEEIEYPHLCPKPGTRIFKAYTFPAAWRGSGYGSNQGIETFLESVQRWSRNLFDEFMNAKMYKNYQKVHKWERKCLRRDCDRKIKFFRSLGPALHFSSGLFTRVGHCLWRHLSCSSPERTHWVYCSATTRTSS